MEHDESSVNINGKRYPKWAVERAEAIVQEHGGNLEHLIACIIAVKESFKNAKPADPNESIRAFIPWKMRKE